MKNGIIIHSDLLLEYLKNNYPDFYFVSSTTKVLTDFDTFVDELNKIKNSHQIGDTVKLKVNREGSERTVEVTIGEQP